MYALDIGLGVVGIHYFQILGGPYLRRSSSFLMTHSTPDLLHCMHSLSPEGTTQRIRRSRHEAHAIEALWRGFENFSFVEGPSIGSCSNLGSVEDDPSLWKPFCLLSIVLAILVGVDAVMTVCPCLEYTPGPRSFERGYQQTTCHEKHEVVRFLGQRHTYPSHRLQTSD
jgi:hypothetical protein